MKVDYLREFAEWMYTNSFPVQDAVGLVYWAIEILLGMKFEAVHLEAVASEGELWLVE